MRCLISEGVPECFTLGFGAGLGLGASVLKMNKGF